LKKKIAILGAGESGVGSAILARKKGYGVFVSDYGRIRQKYKDVLTDLELSYEEGKHSEELILDAGEVIKSPGIPDMAPIVMKARQMGIPVISEIEFAGRFTRATTVCITGSNGKTTTTLLTHHILKKAGMNVGLAGNVGQSFAWQVAEHDFDYYVLEISSFQLDGMMDFRADIAVLMNITPDHLDRYEHDFGKYTASKFRIIRNQRPEDAFIFCDDDPVIRQEMQARQPVAQLYPFSIEHKPTGPGAWINEGNMIIELKQNLLKMTLEQLALQGKHNIYNSMAAGVAARILDIRKDIIKESLSDFQNVAHRLEFVARIHGVDFINDSKATNVNSTWYALESMANKVVWIAGGVDKGNDYSLLKDLVKGKVKAIVCLGQKNENIITAFGSVVENIYETGSMEEAVNLANHLAKKDDTVLLSPACASFDLFENFEERGDKFKEAVNRL
jgi:UDP-N-acetylmuramoylalanine--D-glutamate ligase